MSNKTDDFCLAKVVIIGDSGVGKTNLMTKYCEGIFKESYVATIGVDFKLKDIKVGDQKMRLQIWDTAGQERFRNITQAYFKGARGIILAFDLTCEDSFGNLAAWTRQVDTTANDALVRLLVGTKVDLVSERVVSVEAAEAFAQKHSMQYIEVSARNGTNVI
jgi:Ras-related protein Rab-8A